MIKAFLHALLIFGGALFWFFVAVHFASGEKVIRYDCTIAEISPDFPTEVRNECRKLRSVKPIST